MAKKVRVDIIDPETGRPYLFNATSHRQEVDRFFLIVLGIIIMSFIVFMVVLWL